MCPSKEDQNKLIVSQNDAEHQSHLGKVQEGTRSHLVFLDVRDDQKIFLDNAPPKRTNRPTFEAMSWEERDEDLDGYA